MTTPIVPKVGEDPDQAALGQFKKRHVARSTANR
jgi:hypothetical protein